MTTPYAPVAPHRQAVPLRYEDLTQQQRDQLWAIGALLDGFRKTTSKLVAPTRSNGITAPNLLYDRPANVILIEGGRGSGKTSILLTLLDWLICDPGLDVTRRPPASDQPPWIDLARHYLPQTPLDLQPLPRDTNLIAWIGMRLLSIVEDVYGACGDNKHRDWLDSDDLPPGVQQTWRAVLESLARGWDGSTTDKKGSIDPNWSAYELGEAAASKLDLVEQWRSFVDAVVGAVADALNKKRVKPSEGFRILIGIDDADLHPHHCNPLLHALSQMWHPRLCFVLAGDARLFHRMLKIGFLEHLKGPSDDPGHPGPSDALMLARELELHAFEKVVPQPHRFALKPLTGPERLGLLAGLLTEKSATADAPGDNARTALGRVFELVPQSSLAVSGNIRMLLALRGQLEGKDLPAGGRRIWEAALDSADLPGDEVRRVLERAFVEVGDGLRVDVPGEVIVERFETGELGWGPDFFRFDVLADWATLEQRWPGVPWPSASRRSDSEAATIAAFQVAVETLAGGNPLQQLPSTFRAAPSGLGIPLIVRRLNANPGAGYRAVDLVWALPDLPTVGAYARIRDAFDASINGVDLSNASRVTERIEARERALIDCYLCSVSQEILRWHKDPDSSWVKSVSGACAKVVEHSPAPGDVWQTLFAWLLEANLNLDPVVAVAVIEWVRYRVVLLAAPEFGLRASTANLLLEAWAKANLVRADNEREFGERIGRNRALSAQTVVRGMRASDREENSDSSSRLGVEWRVAPVRSGAPPNTLLPEVRGATEPSSRHDFATWFPFQSTEGLSDRLLASLDRFTHRDDGQVAVDGGAGFGQYLRRTGLDRMLRDHLLSTNRLLQSLNAVPLRSGRDALALRGLWDAVMELAPELGGNPLRELVHFGGANADDVQTQLNDPRFWSEGGDSLAVAEPIRAALGAQGPNVKWLGAYLDQTKLQIPEPLSVRGNLPGQAGQGSTKRGVTVAYELSTVDTDSPFNPFQISGTVWAVLMLIRDFEVDRQNKRCGRDFEPAEPQWLPFQLARTRLDWNEGNVGVAWPVPKWRAYQDLVLMARGWSSLPAGVRKDDDTLARQSAEGLLLGFVQVLIGVAHNRVPSESPGSIELAPTSQHWVGVVRKIGAGLHVEWSSNIQGWREKAWSSWALYCLPLLACPEFALPDASAAALLDAWAREILAEGDRNAPDEIIQCVLGYRTGLYASPADGVAMIQRLDAAPNPFPARLRTAIEAARTPQPTS